MCNYIYLTLLRGLCNYPTVGFRRVSRGVFRQKPTKPPSDKYPSFLGVTGVLSYFLTRTSSRRKSANTPVMPTAFLLVRGR